MAYTVPLITWWSRSVGEKLHAELHNWFSDTEMFAWIKENVPDDGWALTSKAHDDYEYDSVIFGHDVSILYEDDTHAVLHKLRWW